MEEITGQTPEVITGRTIEDFVYQNEKFYFSGKHIKDDEAELDYIRGCGYKFGNEGEKELIGQIYLVIKHERTSLNFYLKKDDNLSLVMELTQNIISVL